MSDDKKLEELKEALKKVIQAALAGDEEVSAAEKANENYIYKKEVKAFVAKIAKRNKHDE